MLWMSNLKRYCDKWLKVLCKEDDSRYFRLSSLGRTLDNQEKYAEAEEVWRQVAKGREKVLLALSATGPATKTPEVIRKIPEAVTTQLGSFFPDGDESRGPYNDSDVQTMFSLLKHLDRAGRTMKRRSQRGFAVLSLVEKEGPPSLLQTYCEVSQLALPFGLSRSCLGG